MTGRPLMTGCQHRREPSIRDCRKVMQASCATPRRSAAGVGSPARLAVSETSPHTELSDRVRRRLTRRWPLQRARVEWTGVPTTPSASHRWMPLRSRSLLDGSARKVNRFRRTSGSTCWARPCWSARTRRSAIFRNHCTASASSGRKRPSSVRATTHCMILSGWAPWGSSTRYVTLSRCCLSMPPM